MHDVEKCVICPNLYIVKTRSCRWDCSCYLKLYNIKYLRKMDILFNFHVLYYIFLSFILTTRSNVRYEPRRLIIANMWDHTHPVIGRGLEALALKVGIVAWTIICGIRLVVNKLNQSATQTYSWVYKYCWISIVKICDKVTCQKIGTGCPVMTH